MKVLAIDIGATSGRIMTVTYENNLFSYQEEVRFPTETVNQNGVLCWNIQKLIHTLTASISKILEKEKDISSIGIDTWGVDYGVLSKDGTLLSLPKCYRNDFRAGKEKILKKISFEKIYEITGIQEMDFNTIFQLTSENRDWSQVDKMLLIPDLIAYYLTGSKRMELTNASTTSLFDRKKMMISPMLIKALGLPSSIFAPLIRPGEIYGNLKKEFVPANFRKDIPVIAVCTHDTASAVLGTNGFYHFAYLSSGTWSLLGTELSNPIINPNSLKANFTNEIGYNNTIRFLKNTMGMFLINEVRKDYSKMNIRITTNDLVPLIKQAGAVNSYLDVNDPLFSLPNNMLDKIKKYLLNTKQEVPNTPAEVLKMIYQSMALSYSSLITNLETLTGYPTQSLIIVGGGNQAQVLNQYTANCINKTVVTGSSEATILGNALAQFISLKQIPDVKAGRAIINHSIKEQTYLPQDKLLWDEIKFNFKKIVKD